MRLNCSDQEVCVFCVSKDLFVLREHSVNKLKCVVMSRMMFLLSEDCCYCAIISVSFQKGKQALHCLLCYVIVSVCLWL
jgi:hypothetical protein